MKNVFFGITRMKMLMILSFQIVSKASLIQKKKLIGVLFVEKTFLLLK